MCASTEASTMATSTSLCTTSSDRRDELGAAGDARLAGLEVHLHVEAVGEVAQQRRRSASTG